MDGRSWLAKKKFDLSQSLTDEWVRDDEDVVIKCWFVANRAVELSWAATRQWHASTKPGIHSWDESNLPSGRVVPDPLREAQFHASDQGGESLPSMGIAIRSGQDLRRRTSALTARVQKAKLL